ncbi:MAG: PH domain-containing protein [Rikenellaceae bacterium]
MKLYSRASRLTITLTIIYILALVGFEVWMYFHVQSSFLPAVINSIIFILASINLLSIPRFTRITESGIEICCVLDITHIPLGEIRRVEVVERGALSWSFPVLGIYGLFGYYGWFLNLRKWRISKCYTRSLRGCVVIKRHHGCDLIVGVNERDEFVKQLTKFSVEVS